MEPQTQIQFRLDVQQHEDRFAFFHPLILAIHLRTPPGAGVLVIRGEPKEVSISAQAAE